ncbi:MAG: hypothetical protein IKV79_03950, partial [Oscillospiraceae bacterium]|nr:hypothetical protein [Oscillospiraceae bacterium]
AKEVYYMGYTADPNSFQNAGMIEYSYNEKGQLTGIHGFEGLVALDCEYDADGKLVESAIDSNGVKIDLEAFYGESGELEAYFENGSIQAGEMVVKDAEGRVIREAKYENNTSEPVTEYKYDADGKLVLSTVLDPGGQEDQNVYRSFEYDSEGRLVSGREYTGILMNLEKYGDKLYYTVDEAGRVLTEERYNFEDTYISTYINTYNEAGELAKQIYIWFCPPEMFNSGYYTFTETEFEYDAQGREIKSISFNYDADDKDADYKANGANSSVLNEYEYDKEGRRVRTYYKYLGGEDYAEIREETWSYDAEGRLVEMASGHGDISGDTYKYVSKYYYDAQGRLDKEEYLEFYKGNGGVITNYDYIYDAAGNLIKYEASTGEGTVIKTENYEYDAMGNNVFYEIIEWGNVTSRGYFQYDANGYLLDSEVQSVNEGISVITEVSYTTVPATENGEFFNIVLNRFMELL